MSERKTPQNPGPPPHPFSADAKPGSGPGSARRRRFIFGGIALGVIVLFAALMFFVLSNLGSPGDPENHTNNGSAETTDPAPTTPANITRWPANMATGSIIFTGEAGEVTVVGSEAMPEGTQPLVPNLAPGADGSEANRIQLYVDYRCPYCAAFEEANSDTFEEVLADGSTALEMYPLAFLDKFSDGTYYSSRATGMMACIATIQPELTWEAHKKLLDPAFQPSEGNGGYDNEELSAAIAGLNEGTRSCIAEERYVPFAGELTEWVFANPVPFAKDPKLAVEGTPLAVVNGVPYSGNLADGAAFRKFLKAQGIQLQ